MMPVFLPTPGYHNFFLGGGERDLFLGGKGRGGGAVK